MTWLDLIRRALRLSGAIYLGQTPSADYEDLGFEAGALMLSSWSRDGVLPPALITKSLTVVPNQVVYTAGPSGDIDARPVELDSVMITGGSLGQIKNVVRIENWINWNQIALPRVPAIPYLIAMNPEFPTAKLYVYPEPMTTFEMLISAKFAWADILSIRTSAASLPPGFADAFCDCLADKIADELKIQTEEIELRASTSYKNLILSMPVWPIVQPNPRGMALQGTPGTVNWITGTPNS